jgi:hypothetical protein
MEKKMSLSKEVQKSLFDFVEKTFVDEKPDELGNAGKQDKQFSEQAYTMLLRLFEAHALTLLETSAGKSKQKGGAHNSDDSKYLSVSDGKVKCALLVKLVFRDKPMRKFLRFIVVPDDKKITKAGIDSFVPVYLADRLAELGGDVDLVVAKAAAIRFATEIRNNSAQETKNKLEKTEKQIVQMRKQAGVYVRMNTKVWEAERANCMTEYSEDFVLFIEDQRALVAETKV